MSTYFVAYLQIWNEKKEIWESVGPFSKNGKLLPFYETAGDIRDAFSSHGFGEYNVEGCRKVNEKDLNLKHFSEEIIKKMYYEGEPCVDYYSYISLAALHQEILKTPEVKDFDVEWTKDMLRGKVPYPTVPNPAKHVLERAYDLIDMMGYYVFDATDEETVRIVYGML